MLEEFCPRIHIITYWTADFFLPQLRGLGRCQKLHLLVYQGFFTQSELGVETKRIRLITNLTFMATYPTNNKK